MYRRCMHSDSWFMTLSITPTGIVHPSHQIYPTRQVHTLFYPSLNATTSHNSNSSTIPTSSPALSQRPFSNHPPHPHPLRSKCTNVAKTCPRNPTMRILATTTTCTIKSPQSPNAQSADAHPPNPHVISCVKQPCLHRHFHQRP